MYTHKVEAHTILKLCLLAVLSTISGCAHEGAHLGMQSGARQEIAIEPCDNCGTVSTACKFCSRCRSVRYCSKDCQRAHWKSGHKLQCTPSDATLPSPSVRITKLPQSIPQERRPVSLYVGGVLDTMFCDAPFKEVKLTDEQEQFLNELMEISDRQNLGREAQEAALKRKAQEIFDHCKAQQANSNSPASSLIAKKNLITIVDVIKFKKRPQDWDWINWALMGVGDDQWRYMP
jgi:hypothetical protein